MLSSLEPLIIGINIPNIMALHLSISFSFSFLSSIGVVFWKMSRSFFVLNFHSFEISFYFSNVDLQNVLSDFLFCAIRMSAVLVAQASFMFS